jgi:hypothetical protein
LYDRIAALGMGVGIPSKVWGIFVFTTMAKIGVDTSLASDEMDI